VGGAAAGGDVHPKHRDGRGEGDSPLDRVAGPSVASPPRTRACSCSATKVRGHKVGALWTIAATGRSRPRSTRYHGDGTSSAMSSGARMARPSGTTPCKPRVGEDFWVAGYNVATGAQTRYHLQATNGPSTQCTPTVAVLRGWRRPRPRVEHRARWRVDLPLSGRNGPRTVESLGRDLIQPGAFRQREKLVTCENQ